MAMHLKALRDEFRKKNITYRVKNVVVKDLDSRFQGALDLLKTLGYESKWNRTNGSKYDLHLVKQNKECNFTFWSATLGGAKNLKEAVHELFGKDHGLREYLRPSFKDENKETPALFLENEKDVMKFCCFLTGSFDRDSVPAVKNGTGLKS